jgi:hypothetical protein
MKYLLAAAFLAPFFLPPVKQAEAEPKTKGAQQGEKKFLLDVSNARATSGRVPSGYGKLGLTRTQRERIYGIQAAYAARIKELEAEIEQLKAEQVVRVRAVLNDGQREQLDGYEAQLSERRTLPKDRENGM